MKPEEIKKYFENNPPPTSVDWKPWAKITDTQKFLNGCYSSSASFKGGYDKCPSNWHLKEFYKDIVFSRKVVQSKLGRLQDDVRAYN
jgi:hypothetical protein